MNLLILVTIDNKSSSKTTSSNESLSHMNTSDSKNVDADATDVSKHLTEIEKWANNQMSSEMSELLTRVTLNTDNGIGYFFING